MSLQEILNLPTADRLNVIERIWDSINKQHIEISESQKEELDRRIDLDNNNKIQWLSYNEMKDQLGRHY